MVSLSMEKRKKANSNSGLVRGGVYFYKLCIALKIRIGHKNQEMVKRLKTILLKLEPSTCLD